MPTATATLTPDKQLSFFRLIPTPLTNEAFVAGSSQSGLSDSDLQAHYGVTSPGALRRHKTLCLSNLGLGNRTPRCYDNRR